MNVDLKICLTDIDDYYDQEGKTWFDSYLV